MSKRTAISDNGPTHSKRQKSSESTVAKKASEEICSSRQLQQLLAFQQDAGPQLRQGIQSFKVLLEAIAYGEDIEDRERKQEVLSAFLQSQRPREDDHVTNYLPDLFQTWSFAAQSNNDSLLSAVPAVLALLIKTISSLVDFREYGTLLCKTLLRREQLKLLDRGLTANKTKEHLISPCLRLLTEIVSFDGGSSARSLYLHRDITFKRLDTFLSLRRVLSEDDAKDARRPSVRNNAVRYLLANIKLQDKTAKADILSQGKLLRSLFQGIKEDAPNIISEILTVLKKHVVLDDTLPRAAKSRVLTDFNLGRIATLYGFKYEEDHVGDASEHSQTTTQDMAHNFLLFVCTTLDHGVLTAQTGWYPPGTKTVRTDLYAEDAGDEHIVFDRLTHIAKYQDRVAVRNTTLAAFLQTLRPYADMQQRELLLAIFDAAPELIADYFFKRKSFSFEPKLTATWIGFSAFLFSAVQLPVPLYFGLKSAYGDVPPPVPIAIESILPQPLSQKVLTRCLNQNVELITFFAVRLLTSAFLKLKNVLESFHAVSGPNKDQWEHAASQLVSEFCRRCPEMKHVVAVFRSCPLGKSMLREAVTRLLSMYYKVIPQMALLEKFDISIALSVALNNTGEINQDSDGRGVRLLELDHLLEIAYRSPDMRWWHKSDHMPLSPFTTILKLAIESHKTRPSGHMRNLLHSIVRDNAILQQHTEKPSLDALLDSLVGIGDWHASDAIFQFLDNCIVRYVRKPVKYYDDLAKLDGDVPPILNEPANRPISLLLVVLMEQWPFLLQVAEPSSLSNVAEWLVRFLDYLRVIGEDPTMLSNIRDQIRSQVKDKACRGILKRALKEIQDPVSNYSQGAVQLGGLGQANEPLSSEPRTKDTLLIMPQTPTGPPKEDENHPELTRWTQKDVSDAVEDGTIGQLILCLCSTYEEIRKQAFGNLLIFLAKVQASNYSEQQQVYVLVGEIIDTVRDGFSDGPLPYFVGAIAARSLLVLADPSHVMYIKVNRFLNKGPPWTVSKLPSYWIDKIMLHPPSDADAHDDEIGWLLDALLEGLRTPSDMNLYRRCHVFERLLSLYASPSLSAAHLEKILLILFRCTYVDGSDTLITRAGIISWISSQVAQKRPDEAMVRRLAQRVYQTCSQERINGWSDGTLVTTIDRLVRPYAG